MNEHKESVQIIPQGARQSITFIQSKKMDKIYKIPKYNKDKDLGNPKNKHKYSRKKSSIF